MKFYSYSVKEILQSEFGDNTLFEMRKPHDSWRYYRCQEEFTAFCWQYADEKIIQFFTDEVFLDDTEICEDYIAYKGKWLEKDIVYLVFMTTEDEIPFSFDANYAERLVKKWKGKGYEAFIVCECISPEFSDNKVIFRSYSKPGCGTMIHTVSYHQGKPFLEYYMDPCWDCYYRKELSVVESDSISEYKCLFEDDIKVYEGERKNNKILYEGIEGVKSFLTKNQPVRIGYIDQFGNNIYFRSLCAGNWILKILVNTRNLISNVEIELENGSCQFYANEYKRFGSLVSTVPKITEIRLLSFAKMHGIVLQIDYEKNIRKNYYVKMFDTPIIPNSITIDGTSYEISGFDSFSVVESGICFINGFYIDEIELYYKSYRQVNIEYTGNTVYEDDDLCLRSVYRLPLKQFKSHFTYSHYRGFDDECYGPNEPIVDPEGNRITDIATFYIYKNYFLKDISKVGIEPTGKYGLMNSDGSWFVPPIYDDIEPVRDDIVYATKTDNGEKSTFLINEDGEVIYFPFFVDYHDVSPGLIPFNAKEWEGNYIKPGLYWKYDMDDGLEPGNWGYIDVKGKIVVEPQYYFATGFWNGDGHHAVVARLCNEELLWGVIDESGKETIPCSETQLLMGWGDDVIFRRKGEELLGMMGFDGDVILEPRFGYIEEYYSDKGLVIAGDDEDYLGLFSIQEERFIIPTGFGYIGVGDCIIDCELPYSSDMKYFDLNGKELEYEEYSRISEKKDRFGVWKDDKYGEIRIYGEPIIPCMLMDSGDDTIALYKKGYLVSGERKSKGLRSLSGEMIIPEKYSDLYYKDPFLVAVERTEGNWRVKETLLLLSGKTVLEGLIKDINIDKSSNYITVKTPLGEEVLQIQR